MGELLNKRINAPRKDEAGNRYGMLVGVCRDGNSGKNWIWRCDCGNEKSINATNVRRGNTTSCGCVRSHSSKTRMTRHGLYHSSKAYHAWALIKKRCNAKTGASYRDYASKGIKICEQWENDPEAFVAYIGEPPMPEMTIDRIDNSRGYEPGNIRWATMLEQASNKTNNRIVSVNGKRMTLSRAIRLLADEVGVSEGRMRSRVERYLYQDKMSVKEVIDNKAYFRGQCVYDAGGDDDFSN